ncbi:MAG: protein kinase [Gemmataceae bacterium]
MAITVRCPNPQCGQTFHVPDSYAGKTGRCHACKSSFPIPAAGSGPSEQVVEKPAQGAGVGVGVPQTIGRFQLRAKLGAGAFGTVYRAHDPQLDREVALKVPQAAVLDSPKRVERFLREAKAAAALRHPNIVPVYDAGVTGGQHFIASAFIEGQPLAKAVGEKGVGNSRAARIVRDLAEALAYAHAAGVVHRDVKPANVMLDAEDQPHLMDFGLAARLESTEKLTHEGAVLGTPSYMAPEQARGQEGEARPQSDQYALGVVLYELLTGRTPFEGPPQVVLFNVLNTAPPSPRGLRKDIPKDLETICLKAMAKAPARRYSDCQAMADDLRRWLEGEPIKARRPSLGENLARWFKQDPRLAGAIVTTVAALAVAAGALFWRLGEAVAETARVKAEGEAQRAKAEEALGEQHKAAADALADGDQQRLRVAEQMAERNDLGGIPAVLDGVDPARRGWAWQHLRLRGEGAAVRLLRGNHGLAGLAFRPDSQVLACAGQGGQVHLWDVHTGKESKRQVPDVGWGVRTALSADGSRLVVCRLPEQPWYPFNPLLGLSAAGLAGLPGMGPVQAAVNLAAGWRVPLPAYRPPLKPNHVTVHDLRSGAEVARWQTPPGHQVFLAVDAAGKHVAVSVGEWNEPARLSVYDGGSGKVVTAFEKPFAGLAGVVLSPDGERVVTLSGEEGKPRKGVVWETKTGREAFPLATGDDSPTAVVYSPDGKRLASFSGGAVAIQRAVKKTVSEQVPVTSTVVAPDGRLQQVTTYQTVTKEVMVTEQATESRGAPTVRIHDAGDGRELVAITGCGPNVTAMAFSPDAGRLATTGFSPCSPGGEVQVWDAVAGSRLVLLKTTAPGHLTLLAFSPDGRHVAAGPAGFDPVTLWSAADGRLLHAIDQQGRPVCSVAFSPDGGQLATYSACDQTARVFEAREDEAKRAVRVQEVLAVPGSVIPLSFSRDGARLSGGRGGVGCYGPAYGGYGMPIGNVHAVGFGGYLKPGRPGAAGCPGVPGGCAGVGRFGVGTSGYGCVGYVRSPSLSAWSREGMRPLTYPKQAGQVLAVSPDNKRIAALADAAPGQNEPPSVQVWDVESGKELYRLKGPGAGAEVQFSPDGELVAAFWTETEMVTKTEKRVPPPTKGEKGPAQPVDVQVCYPVSRSRLKVWGAADGKERFAQDDASGAFDFSPDGGLLACGTAPSPITPSRPKVVVWDARAAKAATTLGEPSGPACVVRFAPDGKAVVAFIAGQPPHFVDEMRTGYRPETKTRMVKKPVERGGKQVEEEVPETYTVNVPYQFTVKKLVKSPSQLTAWDARSGKELLSKRGVVELLAFSPDGGRLATVTAQPQEPPAPMGAPGMPVPMPPQPGGVSVPAPAARGDGLEERHFVSSQFDAPAMPMEPEPMPGQPAKPRWKPVIQVWSLTSGEEMLHLEGHATPVTALAYSPDGSRLVSADLGPGPAPAGHGQPMNDPCANPAATLVVWDAAAGAELARFGGHTAQVNCAAWRPDGRWFATASDDGTVKLWEAPVVKTPLSRYAGTLGDHDRRHWAVVAGVAASPDGKLVASAGDDGEVKLHDVATGRTVGVLRGHNAGARAVAWRPDGQRLASTGWDDSVRVWDVAEQAEVRSIPLNQPTRHRGAGWGIAWSRDGGKLAVGTHGSKTVCLYDAETGRLLRETPEHPGHVTSVAFSPDGGRLVSTSEGGSVKLWNADSLAEVRSFPGHKGHVRGAAFTPDGQSLYTAGDDGTVKVWEVETGKEKQSHACGTDVRGVAVAPDGATLAAALGNWMVQLRRATDGQVLHTLKGYRHPVLGVAFAAGGSRLATGGWDRTVRLWDVAAGEPLLPPAGHTGELYHVCASPDGQTIASAGDDGTVRLWDVASRREKLALKGDGSPLSGVAFARDGQELISGGHDGRVRVWSLATGKEVRRFFDPGSGGLRTLAYGPEGKVIATSHDHGHVIRVWDLASGKVLKKLTGHKSVVSGLAFTADGDLVSASHDGTVKVWDVAAGKEKRTLTRPQPHWAYIYGLAMDASGKRAAVTHNHGVVRVWDVSTGQLLREVTGLDRGARGVAFGKAGVLAVSDHGGTLRLYDPETLTESARFRLGPHQGLIPCVCATPDGRFVATGNGDGTLSLVGAP